MLVGKKRSVLVVGSVAAALSLSGCENMNAGGWIGMLAGGAAGAYAGDAYLEPADGTGDGTMMLMGAFMGASLGMLLGSGAVTPGEMTTAMVQANENIRAEEQQKAAEAVGYGSGGASNTSSATTTSSDSFDLSAAQSVTTSSASASNGARLAEQTPQAATVTRYFYCTALRDGNDPQMEDLYYSLVSEVSGDRWNTSDHYGSPVQKNWQSYIQSTVPGSHSANCIAQSSSSAAQQRRDTWLQQREAAIKNAGGKRRLAVIVPVSYSPTN